MKMEQKSFLHQRKLLDFFFNSRFYFCLKYHRFIFLETTSSKTLEKPFLKNPRRSEQHLLKNLNLMLRLVWVFDVCMINMFRIFFILKQFSIFQRLYFVKDFIKILLTNKRFSLFED